MLSVLWKIIFIHTFIPRNCGHEFLIWTCIRNPGTRFSEIMMPFWKFHIEKEGCNSQRLLPACVYVNFSHCFGVWSSPLHLCQTLKLLSLCHIEANIKFIELQTLYHYARFSAVIVYLYVKLVRHVRYWCCHHICILNSLLHTKVGMFIIITAKFLSFIHKSWSVNMKYESEHRSLHCQAIIFILYYLKFIWLWWPLVQ